MQVTDSGYSSNDPGISDEEHMRREAEAKERRRRADVVAGIASRLEADAQKIEGQRTDIETQWYDCMRQYYGRYSEEIESALKKKEQSRLFIHMTRPKTDQWIARIFDLLFPTDDANWGIGATPVPEIENVIAADKSNIPTGEMIGNMAKAGQNQIEEAGAAAESMEREMKDQLVGCSYSSEARNVVENMCKLGSGVMKGPVDGGSSRKRWVRTRREDGSEGEYQLKSYSDNNPSFTSVEPWNFYPDPNATSIKDAEYTYERHIWTKKKLRKMTAQLDLDREAARELLEAGPKGAMPNYIQQIRSIAHASQVSAENKYIIWEYRGPIEQDELKDLFLNAGDPDGWEAMEADLDPLTDLDVVIFVCQGKVLKFGIHHLDSCEPVYSIVNFVSDAGTLWGWGVPALMRDSQSAANAAWRMMLDNGALSAGPQIVVNKKAVEPEDGKWELKGRKVWLAKDDAPNGIAPFSVFNIDNNQSEIANILNFAREFVNEEVSLPSQDQSEPGGRAANTIQGLAMIMNSANVIFRRVIKNFDDDLTVPCLRRLYDWNMQFSDKDEIKGDMKVKAQGSSVLLVRELQSQNLMALMQLAVSDPELGAWIKKEKGLMNVVKAMMLSTDEMIYTEEEYEARQKQAQEAAAAEAAAQPQQAAVDPSIEFDQKRQLMELEWSAKFQLEEMRQQTQMMQIAEQRNMKLEELDRRLEGIRMTNETKERLFAGEVGYKTKLAREEAQGRAVEVPGTRFGGAA